MPRQVYITTLFDNHLHVLLGYLNYDMLSNTKSKPLADIMELFDYKKLIKVATCFKKGLPSNSE